MGQDTQKMLTLDFWKDNVAYAGHTVPTGTLACAALNISDEIIDRLDQLCAALNLYMGALQVGMAQPTQMLTARGSALQIVELLSAVPPFSFSDSENTRQRVQAIFSEDYLQSATEYAQALANGRMASPFAPEYEKALTLLRVVPVMAQLGFSLRDFKNAILPFAEKLHECDRTPDGYAVEFGNFFSNTLVLSEESTSWMSTTNVSVQYVASTIPGKGQPQLVKRMHYVSFVGMFRSDLFEGLCVGHAPRKCPICGTWFLTTDARYTKYCGGLAPGDKRGRTCRQIGNLRGREQRELADDHPLKKIYERRTNTIIQNLRRGKLDDRIASTMKRLAKDKLERAISDPVYAAGPYATEMEQAALLEEAQKYLN